MTLCDYNNYHSSATYSVLASSLPHMQVFFAILIGAFSLGQAVPHLGKFVTAVGASSVVYGIIDRVSIIICTMHFGISIG